VTVFILVALARTEGAVNLTGRVADIVVVVFYATVAAGLILVGGGPPGETSLTRWTRRSSPWVSFC
jgi:hypothetical protein